MIRIYSCDTKELKKKYIDFVYSLYKNDTSFVGSSVFELKNQLHKKTRNVREVYVDAILVSNDDNIKVAAMFFFSNDLPVLQVGFFEAVPHAQAEVDAMLTYARKLAKRVGAGKIVIGLNGHVSVGVGLLNFKKTADPIAFDSLYSKLYYPDYFRKHKLTESTLSTYKGITEHVLKRINSRKIDYQDMHVRPMDKQNFEQEIRLMTQISNVALKETELFYPLDANELLQRLKKIKSFLKPYDLLFAMHNGKEIGYIFTHPDFNQVLPAGKRISKLSMGLRLLFCRKQIDTIKLNTVCMTEKRSAGLQQLIKVRTQYAKDDGHRMIETNFIFDSNRSSALLALRQGYSKYNTYSIFYMEVADA